MKIRILLVLAFLLTATGLRAQTVINGNQVYVPGGSLGVQIPNEASTGTTQYSIAKLTGSGTAVIATTLDTAGLVGIVKYSAGKTGSAGIVQVGQTPCTFDGPTTANDYVIESVTVNGDCSDAGAVLPTVQNVGRVLTSNAGAGLYQVLVSASGGVAPPSSIGGSIANTQIAVGSGVNTVSGSSALTSAGGGITSTVASQTTINFTVINTTSGDTGTLGMTNAGGLRLGQASSFFQADASGNLTMTSTGGGIISSLASGGISLAPVAAGSLILGRAADSNSTNLIYGPLTFEGSGSGSASLGVASAAGTPETILLPTTTAASTGLVLGVSSLAGGVQQLGYLTVATITGSTPVPGNCTEFSGTNSISDAGVTCNGTGSSGTVTSFSSGNLSPLFTTSVATSTVTPALSFSLSTALAEKVFANCTGSTASPSYQSLTEACLPATTVFTDASATFGANTYDFSGATIFKVKTAAAYAPTVDGQCGVNTTTHLFVCGFNGASTITIPVTIAATTHEFINSYNQATGAFTETQPSLADLTAGSAIAGLFDFSAGTFKLPVSAAGTVTANGNIAYGTTAGSWNLWASGQSNLLNVTPSSITPINNDCMIWVVSGSNFTTADSGYKCVKNFSDLNTFSNGVNSQSGAGYTILLSDGGKLVTLSNAAAEAVTLPSVVPAAGYWVDLQNIGAGTWTSNRNAHNIDGSTTNFVLTTGQGIRVYSDGSNYFTQRGVGGGGGGSGTVTSVALGAPAGFTVSGAVTTSGTLSFAMPAGWTTGDILYGNGSNSVARLAGTTSATPSVYTSTGTGVAAQAPALTASVGGGANPVFATLASPATGDYLCENPAPSIVNCQPGVVPNPQAGTSYIVLAADRGKYLTFTNASPVAVTLAQSGTTGFASNFFFAARNLGAGAVTITPTTSTINGGASLVLLAGMQANIFSDNSNYFATISGYASATTSSIGGALLAGACDSGTVTVNGATTGMVATASPTSDPQTGTTTGLGVTIYAFVSSANTVTVRVCAISAVTPNSVTYNVSVFPKVN